MNLSSLQVSFPGMDLIVAQVMALFSYLERPWFVADHRLIREHQGDPGGRVGAVLRVYVKCVDGQDGAARKRFEAALRVDRPPGSRTSP